MLIFFIHLFSIFPNVASDVRDKFSSIALTKAYSSFSNDKLNDLTRCLIVCPVFTWELWQFRPVTQSSSVPLMFNFVGFYFKQSYFKNVFH